MNPEIAIELIFFLAVGVVLLVFFAKSRGASSKASSVPPEKVNPIPPGEAILLCPHCRSTEIGMVDDTQPLDKAVAKCLGCGRELGLFIEMKYEVIPEKRHFFQNVHGIYHKNTDGTSRQRIIAKCTRGELLELVPEPDNPVDADAVKVCRQNGEQLGYLPEGHRMSQDGELIADYRVTVEEVYRFDDKPRSRKMGCKIRIGVMEQIRRK